MSRWLYTLLYYLLTPLILLRLLYRARKAPAYGRRVAERFGVFQANVSKGGIWLHAVSVGETIAAAPLVRELQARYPELLITITTMTPTGSARVQELFGDSVFHVYAPYDLPTAVARFLDQVQPRLMIIMETELWPNTVNACYQRGIPVLLANARLSAKSARGYGRFSRLTEAMLPQLTRVAAQHDSDGQRFIELGLPPGQLSVTGSIKFDVSIEGSLADQARLLKAQWGERLVWIAASTHEGEEAMLLDVYRRLRQQVPSLLLILVPRHPERFDTVAGLCEGFATARRSRADIPDVDTEIYLADTMGEMLLLLGASDMAFVGGSLIPRGGHNMLEPAAWGLPIVTGDSDFNFQAISDVLQQAGALVKVAGVDDLAAQMSILCDKAELRQQRGEQARAVVAANRGALQRLMDEVEALLC
jgi:3-deoxy-D-manno-octulosonic-acid transferase